MALSEENTRILYKNTIQYLHDIVDQVPNSLNILKSFYASKFRISQLQTKIILDKNKSKSEETCRRCCLNLRETNASYIVKPEVKQSKFCKKLLKKLQSFKKLTKFQAKYAKENDIKNGNKLVIKCNFCKSEIVKKYAKPIKLKIISNPDTLKNTTGKRKRKRKKKDKFAGLEKEAVKSVQENVNQNGKDRLIPVHQVKNNILNNPITQKKEKFKKKKAITKLSDMLNQNSKLQGGKKNNLTLFLQSFNT